MYKLFNYSVSFIFQHRKAILSILILTFMVYGKSLFNHFVEFDEDVLIFQNAMVRNFDIIEIFKLHPNFQDYIPLTFLSYAIEFKLFAKKNLKLISIS